MGTTLCFDFGNTRFKCAIFEGDEYKDTVVLENAAPENVLRLVNNIMPRRILASVVDHSRRNQEILLARETKFHKLSHQSKLPFSIPVAKPETVEQTGWLLSLPLQ